MWRTSPGYLSLRNAKRAGEKPRKWFEGGQLCVVSVPNRPDAIPAMAAAACSTLPSREIGVATLRGPVSRSWLRVCSLIAVLVAVGCAVPLYRYLAVHVWVPPEIVVLSSEPGMGSGPQALIVPSAGPTKEVRIHDLVLEIPSDWETGPVVRVEDNYPPFMRLVVPQGPTRIDVTLHYWPGPDEFVDATAIRDYVDDAPRYMARFRSDYDFRLHVYNVVPNDLAWPFARARRRTLGLLRLKHTLGVPAYTLSGGLLKVIVVDRRASTSRGVLEAYLYDAKGTMRGQVGLEPAAKREPLPDVGTLGILLRKARFEQEPGEGGSAL